MQKITIENCVSVKREEVVFGKIIWNKERVRKVIGIMM